MAAGSVPAASPLYTDSSAGGTDGRTLTLTADQLKDLLSGVASSNSSGSELLALVEELRLGRLAREHPSRPVVSVPPAPRSIAPNTLLPPDGFEFPPFGEFSEDPRPLPPLRRGSPQADLCPVLTSRVELVGGVCKSSRRGGVVDFHTERWGGVFCWYGSWRTSRCEVSAMYACTVHLAHSMTRIGPRCGCAGLCSLLSFYGVFGSHQSLTPRLVVFRSPWFAGVGSKGVLRYFFGKQTGVGTGGLGHGADHFDSFYWVLWSFPRR